MSLLSLGMKHRVVWSAAFIVVLILLQTERSDAANILAFFPFSSRSHNNVYSAITKSLAQNGHHFTVVTAVPLSSPPPNYKQIDAYKEVEKHLNVFNTTAKQGIIDMITLLRSLTQDVCEKVLAKHEVKKLINPTENAEHFDLIIFSSFISECFYAFAHVYKVPVVLISPAGPMFNTYGTVGNVVLPSHIANTILPYKDRMTFPQRLVNTLVTGCFWLYYNYYILRHMEYTMREAFGESTPSISELEKHVSLVLVNHHFSLNGARPLVPSLVEVGGLHIKPPQELPKDLKSFMDSAGKDGVIYFSLGSILKSATLPTETRDVLVGVFSQLKQKVLWKWEDDQPIPGQTKNIRLEKWLPQQDVLAHPNIKLFITHGGLLSFQEAASRGVPLIGIPYFGDQDSNMNNVVHLGVGLKLDPRNLTKENLLNAINKILEDSTYSTEMKKIQTIMADQLDNPLERAVYWIEYVIRHKGAKHLMPASIELAWYQLYMLDVIFVIVILPLLLFSAIIYVIIKLIKKKCCSKKKAIDKSKKKQ